MIILHIVNWIQFAFIYPQEKQHSIIAEEHFEDCVLKAILSECISILIQKSTLNNYYIKISLWIFIQKIDGKKQEQKKTCVTLQWYALPCANTCKMFEKKCIYIIILFLLLLVRFDTLFLFSRVIHSYHRSCFTWINRKQIDLSLNSKTNQTILLSTFAF